ncbi:hypothetical protein [Pseudonocardia phyllosphaerae]|uniref:hypothetical protein n=1 Tax=Pseudonocardia phyllosphaerae TaxID=3390502 RepID=UPI0039799756
MSGPGPVAQRLAALLRATGRTRIPRAAVQRAFLEADPTQVGAATARRDLAAAIAELAEAGVVVPTRDTDDGAPPLPKSIKLVRPAAAPEPAHRDTAPWHPELRAAAGLRSPHALLRQVDAWLFRGGDRAEPAPLRERAYEITGDEKAFDGHLPAPLTLDVLRAWRVTLPLHRERVGDGTVLLVVENADTFDSLRAALQADPGPVGEVAWGAGNAFLSSVASLAGSLAGPAVGSLAGPADARPAEIRYFGDLDVAGLRIPARASVIAEAAGLPPVLPATGLYRTLLDQGRPAPARGADPAEQADVTDVTWLDPPLRGPVRELFAAGFRLAQEAVGRSVLAAGDGWRAGLGALGGGTGVPSPE